MTGTTHCTNTYNLTITTIAFVMRSFHTDGASMHICSICVILLIKEGILLKAKNSKVEKFVLLLLFCTISCLETVTVNITLAWDYILLHYLCHNWQHVFMVELY